MSLPLLQYYPAEILNTVIRKTLELHVFYHLTSLWGFLVKKPGTQYWLDKILLIQAL